MLTVLAYPLHEGHYLINDPRFSIDECAVFQCDRFTPSTIVAYHGFLKFSLSRS